MVTSDNGFFADDVACGLFDPDTRRYDVVVRHWRFPDVDIRYLFSLSQPRLTARSVAGFLEGRRDALRRWLPIDEFEIAIAPIGTAYEVMNFGPLSAALTY